jgi:hypothetical protein
VRGCSLPQDRTPTGAAARRVRARLPCRGSPDERRSRDIRDPACRPLRGLMRATAEPSSRESVNLCRVGRRAPASARLWPILSLGGYACSASISGAGWSSLTVSAVPETAINPAYSIFSAIPRIRPFENWPKSSSVGAKQTHRHPEVRAAQRRASKDGHIRVCFHPSRRGYAAHPRMTSRLFHAAKSTYGALGRRRRAARSRPPLPP